MLFGSKLKRVRLTFGETTIYDYPVWGYFMPDEQSGTIHLDSRIKDKGMLINTLAHEMVHQMQHELGLPLTHGSYFKKQAARIHKFGVTL